MKSNVTIGKSERKATVKIIPSEKIMATVLAEKIRGILVDTSLIRKHYGK